MVDRPRDEAAAATGSAAAAFLVALLLSGDVTDVTSFLIGGCIGMGLVLVGFATASRCRPMPTRGNSLRARLGVLALAVGAGLGAVNLGANLTLANADTGIRVVLAQRFRNLSPVTGVLASPVLEEIALRLFFMSVIAWTVSRFTSRRRIVFAVALVLSSLVFALLHLERAFPADPSAAALYGIGIVVKYGVLSLALGWVFWRWGLPYAIACHSAANAIHLVLRPMVF